MTYNVFGGILNLTQSVNHLLIPTETCCLRMMFAVRFILFFFKCFLVLSLCQVTTSLLTICRRLLSARLVSGHDSIHVVDRGFMSDCCFSVELMKLHLVVDSL